MDFFTGPLKCKSNGAIYTREYENGKIKEISLNCYTNGSRLCYLNGELISHCNYDDDPEEMDKFVHGKPISDKLVKTRTEFDPNSYSVRPLCLIGGIIDGTEITTSKDQNIIHHVNWVNGVKEGPELFYKVSYQTEDKKMESFEVKHWKNGLREEYNGPHRNIEFICYFPGDKNPSSDKMEFFTGKRKYEDKNGNNPKTYEYENGKLVRECIIAKNQSHIHRYFDGEKISFRNYRNPKKEYCNGKPIGDKLIKKYIDFDLKSYREKPFRLIDGIINGTEIISNWDDGLIHHINWKNGVKNGPELFYRINKKNMKLIKINHWKGGLRKEYTHL